MKLKSSNLKKFAKVENKPSVGKIKFKIFLDFRKLI